MIKFPQPSIALTLNHNDHKTVYQTAEEWVVEHGDHYDFRNDEQKARAIATDEIWTLLWFPITPVGHCAIAAPTLEELIDYANAGEAP